MTTDKLPDVVWVQPGYLYPIWFTGDVDHGRAPYVPQSSLDAMTAERDALKRDIAECRTARWQMVDASKRALDERDSAREALAKACEVVREYLECDRLMQMDGCPDDRFSPALTALRALAAQPETKP